MAGITTPVPAATALPTTLSTARLAPLVNNTTRTLLSTASTLTKILTTAAHTAISNVTTTAKLQQSSSKFSAYSSAPSTAIVTQSPSRNKTDTVNITSPVTTATGYTSNVPSSIMTRHSQMTTMVESSSLHFNGSQGGQTTTGTGDGEALFGSTIALAAVSVILLAALIVVILYFK